MKAEFPPPPSDLPPPPAAAAAATAVSVQKPEDSNGVVNVNAVSVNASVRDSSKRGVSNLPAWMTAGKQALSTDTAQQQQQATESDEHNIDEVGQKRKFVPSEANRDGTERRQKIELADGSSMAAIRAANQAEDSVAAETTKADDVDAKPAEPVVSSEEVFASPVNWEAVEATEGLTELLRVWVTDKIIEYLGEEETTMIDFVLHQVTKRCAPQDMLEELTMVLDEDAEGFVVALWQKLLAAPGE